MWSLLPDGLLIQGRLAANSIPWSWLQWSSEASGGLVRVVALLDCIVFIFKGRSPVLVCGRSYLTYFVTATRIRAVPPYRLTPARLTLAWCCARPSPRWHVCAVLCCRTTVSSSSTACWPVARTTMGLCVPRRSPACPMWSACYASPWSPVCTR